MTPLTRGCGVRDQNALYACVSESLDGMPIEWFLVDPVKPWHGGLIRAPTLMRDPRNGIYHMVLGIGATYYPFAPDFVEEARRHGVSKRIPNNLDLSRMQPGLSGMILVHPRALPRFDYVVEPGCPKERWHPGLHDDGSRCIGDLWGLSSAKSYKSRHEVDEGSPESRVGIRTPSSTYLVPRAFEPDGRTRMARERITGYDAGALLFFPKIHLEWVNRDGNAPKGLVEPLITRGWEFKVVGA